MSIDDRRACPVFVCVWEQQRLLGPFLTNPTKMRGNMKKKKNDIFAKYDIYQESGLTLWIVLTFSITMYVKDSWQNDVTFSLKPSI